MGVDKLRFSKLMGKTHSAKMKRKRNGVTSF
jgi:hypothetical protein